MHFDINIIVLLVLNIGLALVFTYYGSRLLNSYGVAYPVRSEFDSSSTKFRAALKTRRPTKRFYIPRLRVKSSSTDDEPPHMPF